MTNLDITYFCDIFRGMIQAYKSPHELLWEVKRKSESCPNWSNWGTKNESTDTLATMGLCYPLWLEGVRDAKLVHRA